MSTPIGSRFGAIDTIRDLEALREEARHQCSLRVALEIRLELWSKRLIAAETELEQRKRGRCPPCEVLKRDMATLEAALTDAIRRGDDYRDAMRKAQRELTAHVARATKRRAS